MIKRKQLFPEEPIFKNIRDLISRQSKTDLIKKSLLLLIAKVETLA